MNMVIFSSNTASSAYSTVLQTPLSPLTLTSDPTPSTIFKNNRWGSKLSASSSLYIALTDITA